MKKLLCVMLIFAALGVTAFADTTFDASLYTKEELREIMEEAALTEELVKTGRLNDRMSVELFIVKYSAS